MSETTTANNLNFDDALALLKVASEDFYISIKIPSLKKSIQFKEINASQQKTLIKAGVDESIFNSHFVDAIYDIIKENIDPKEDYKNITVFDKNGIILSLKEKIGKKITIKKDKITIEDDLAKIIKRFNKIKHPEPTIIEIAYKDEPIQIEIAYPTIEQEHEFELQLKKEKNIKVESSEDLQHVLSYAFVSEITKYINFINIKGSKIVFSDFTYSDRIKIIEKLPTGIVQKCLEKISEWKKDVDDVLYVEDEKTSIPFIIDNSFFLK